MEDPEIGITDRHDDADRGRPDESEIAARDADDEKTRRPYILVTYEASGVWMTLGSIEEYSEDPRELGLVIQELAAEAWLNWPDDNECDRLIVRVKTYTDREIANMPEFPGW